ncbi:MAG: AcrR family transcriptional regulator [Gammaproteobacteria bacterium]|jgi:AcrR family transcriptional regulator
MRVKNEVVRQAILRSAAIEFSEKSYLQATISNIARRAGTSRSNLYVYFKSKLDITLAVYEPWFKDQILQLEKSVGRKKTVNSKLTRLFDGLWKDIPQHKNGMTTTLMQALATATPGDHYSSNLLDWTEDKITDILISIVGQENTSKTNVAAIAHMIMLTFDGVAIRQNLQQPKEHGNEMIAMMVKMLEPLA